MKHPRTGIFALAAVVALAACGDDDATAPEGLTRVQAEALAGAIFGQAYAIAATIPTSGATVADPGSMVARAEVAVDQTWNATVPCELGGSVNVDATVQGTVDDQTGEADLDLSVTQSYAGCQVTGPQGQYQFTLDGSPALTHTASVMRNAVGGTTVSGNIDTPPGGLSWSSGGARGSCDISLTYSGSGTGTDTGEFSVSGNVCNVSFSRSVSFGPG